MPLIRAVALNIIKSMVPLNLPGSQIISYLKELNISYRRTDMLFDIRKAFDRVKYETRIAALKAGQRVPESWMNKEALKQPYNYLVHFKVDIYDPDTETYSTVHRYMYDNENLPVGEFADKFPDYAFEEGSPSEYDYGAITVVGVTKNERMGVPF